MLRKFLIPTVIVSILLLLTTLITIAKTEVTSVVTSTTATESVTTTTAAAATTTAVPITATTTTRVKSTTPRHQRVTIVQAQSANSKGTRVIYYGRKISNNSRRYSSRITANSSSSSSSKADINKSKNKQQLLNNAQETTTSLLPLQPPLNVTSTTTASLILQTEQQQQQQHNRTQQLQQHHQRHQQQKKSKQQQQPRQQQQQHNLPQHEIRQNRQSKQDVADATTTTQPTQKHLINVPQNENDSRTVNLIKNFTEVVAKVELVTPVPPTSTHAYIPFDLDYNDPTEEKSRPPEIVRQTTINEVLSNLFPKGFSDIFRFSYAADPEPEEQPVTTTTTTTTTTTSTTTVKPTQIPIIVIKSTPMPFKLMPTEKDLTKTTAVVNLDTPFPFKPMPTVEQKWLEGFHENESPKVEKSARLQIVTEKIEQSEVLNVTKSQEVRTKLKEQITYTPDNVTQIQVIYTTADPEVEPITTPKWQEVVNTTDPQSAEDSGNTEIVVQQIMTALGSGKSSEEFRDGSNSISKDELLRINRAAKEASVLPSLLVNPQESGNVNRTNFSIPEKAIVILNERGNDDFIEAPEDDNQIAESQNIAHGVYQSPAESVSYQHGQNHDINVHIIHDDSLRKSQDSELQKRAQEPKGGEQPRHLHSYQSFVEQAKYLQNSLQEAPSRKFLKNFNPTLSEGSNPGPVAKGNFHYEQAPESHIQTVPPAAQLQYVLIQRPQQQQEQQQQQQQQQQQHQQQQSQHHQQNTYEVQSQPSYGATQEVSQLHTQISDSEQQDTQLDDNGNQVHVFHIQLPLNMPSEDEKQPQYRSTQEATQHHNHITNYINDNDAYHTVDSENNEKYESVTPMNLIFVTLNTPEPPKEESYARQQPQHSGKGPMLGISKPFKTPSEFVHEAINAQPEPIPDHQPEETENNPKPSGGDNGGRYTYVEVQKSINIHNKLITEKDGRLIEQHETIYPEPKYGDRLEHRPPLLQHVQQHHQAPPNYVSLSQNPIHVAQLDESGEQHELAESLHAEQHALDPSQSLVDIGPIQQSNLVQESHIIESPIQNAPSGPPQDPPQYVEQVEHVEHVEQHEVEQHEVEQHSQHVESHDLPEPSQNPNQPPVQIPYALPPPHQHPPQQPHPQYHQHPLILQEIIEKHVHIPYAVPEPVAVPVAVQHFIDRPVPIETIIEKPVPYPVETIVEKVVEKHVPVEVERIVEKPVEKVVEKYIDRPVAIPIKIPVALQLPSHSSYYSPHFPLTFGGSGQANYGAWQQPPTLTRVPTKVLQSYYAKMLKKLVPQMQQAFKTSPLATKPKTVTKFTAKPNTKQQPKMTDMRYDLKPPPPPALGSSWDVGARYQYDYNTLPLDLSASSSTAVGKQAERPAVSFKTNYDEFQRWRNGHSLKRSPELGMNLHVEYGFKPPLVPSVEIDDKGVPLKAAADLTKGKEE